MARQIINIGSANDAMDGDTIRSGGAKLNADINELYDRSMVWEESVAYAVGDLVRHPTIRKLVVCLTANSDATFIAAKWADFDASGTGSRFAADVAARDALTGLLAEQLIFVRDNGSGSPALYGVEAAGDGTFGGATTTLLTGSAADDALFQIAARANSTRGVAPTAAELTAANDGTAPTLKAGLDARLPLSDGTIEWWEVATDDTTWEIKDTIESNVKQWFNDINTVDVEDYANGEYVGDFLSGVWEAVEVSPGLRTWQFVAWASNVSIDSPLPKPRIDIVRTSNSFTIVDETQHPSVGSSFPADAVTVYVTDGTTSLDFKIPASAETDITAQLVTLDLSLIHI